MNMKQVQRSQYVVQFHGGQKPDCSLGLNLGHIHLKFRVRRVYYTIIKMCMNH